MLSPQNKYVPFGHCEDTLDDWNTERYVVFFSLTKGRNPITVDEMIAGLEAVRDWERVHPLEEYTRRSSRSQAMCLLLIGATERALPLWNGEKHKHARKSDTTEHPVRRDLGMPLEAPAC
jgi:hypothetical protein